MSIDYKLADALADDGSISEPQVMPHNETPEPKESPFVQIWNGVRVYVACVHYGDMMHTQHALSMAKFSYQAAELIRAKRLKHEVHLLQPLDFMRSKLAWIAANPENNFTHLFVYDTDMELRLEYITKLLSRNVACVSGTYFMGGWKVDGEGNATIPYPCVAGRGKNYITRAEIREAKEADRLIEVDGIGCGCLLVTTELLRKVGQPTFAMNWRIGGGSAFIEYEDGYFSRQVQHCGETVWMDPTVQPDHFKMIRAGDVLRDLNGNDIGTFEV